MTAFLNAFRPHPAAGVVLFPSGPDHLPTELTSVTSPALSEAAARALDATEDLFVQALLSGEIPARPCPIPATDGAWAVNEFTRFSPDSGYAQLVHGSGRFLFLAAMQDSTEVFAGIQSRGVLYSVANSVDLRGGGVTTLFHFAFFDDGVRRLRSLLGKSRSPLYEIALALAGEVCRSGQYPSGLSSERMTLQDLARRRVHELALLKGGLDFASPESREALAGQEALEATFGAPADRSAGILFPGALSNDGREYLSVCLQDRDEVGRGRLMPLHPVLQEGLWDLAALAAASPDLVPEC
jgi:hypothetical protein